MTRLTLRPQRQTVALWALWLWLCLFAFAIPGLSFATAASAQSTAIVIPPQHPLRLRADEAIRLLSGEPIETQVFNANFLNAVPPRQFRSFVQQLLQEHGPPQSILRFTPASQTSARMEVAFARSVATLQLDIENEAPFRITGLLVTGFQANAENIPAVVAAIDALPGQQGLMVVPLGRNNGRPVAAIDPDGLYAIASTAKLYILAELDRAIRAGERQWSDVVTLGPKSHPSGISQNWPADSAVTLHTLATLMISLSDNTATDTLIRVIGQNSLGDIVNRTSHSNPQALRPFLMTREVSALKTPANDRLRAQYLRTDRNSRLRLLQRNGDALRLGRIDFAALTAKPNHIDTIEWFASAADIVRLLDYLRREASQETKKILAINPGIGKETAGNWRYIGYKGGSETGVMSMNFLLRSRSGKDYAVAAHWNDRDNPVNEGDFVALMTRLLTLLAER